MAPIADRRPTEIMIQFRGVAIATPQLQNVLGRSWAVEDLGPPVRLVLERGAIRDPQHVARLALEAFIPDLKSEVPLQHTDQLVPPGVSSCRIHSVKRLGLDSIAV